MFICRLSFCFLLNSQVLVAPLDSGETAFIPPGVCVAFIFLLLSLVSSVVSRADDGDRHWKWSSLVLLLHTPLLLLFFMSWCTNCSISQVFCEVWLYKICCLCAFLLLFYLCPAHTFCIQHTAAQVPTGSSLIRAPKPVEGVTRRYLPTCDLEEPAVSGS